MTKPSLRLILPVFAALGVACGGDGGFEPEPREPEPRVFTRLEVTPTDAVLDAVGPGNTLQLAILAYDQAGAVMPGTDAATYSSSAPAIAGVSSSGVVTAAAPGTAEITAAFTLGGITRTASMTVTVYDVTVYDYDYSDIPGVYDLTALVTSFDPAWGDLTGYRYTAILTLQEEWNKPWFGGAYADLQLIGPGGDSSHVADSGFITVSYDQRIDHRGRLIIELVGVGDHIGLTLIVGKLASGFIDGDFGCCGHISGTFTATRRP